MRLYVITGGPCAGKTTLLQELERRKFLIVAEAAKDVILEEQGKGVAEPWLDKNFQAKISELQMKKEADLPSGNGIVFLDRGVPDGLAYCRFRNQKIPSSLSLAMGKCDYEKVFFLEMLAAYEKTSFRAENKGDAKRIAAVIKKTYEGLGFDVISVPPLELAKRADFVIQHL